MNTLFPGSAGEVVAAAVDAWPTALHDNCFERYRTALRLSLPC